VINKRYKFSIIRFFELWILPISLTFFIAFIIYDRFDNINGLALIESIAWVLFIIYAVGIFVYLFLNHLPFARKTQLIILDKTFQVKEKENLYSSKICDITEIIEYSTSKTPWGSIMKWKIKTIDKEIIISSLTISQTSFHRHFWNKITERTTVLPTI
jgi:hypothetical protein